MARYLLNKCEYKKKGVKEVNQEKHIFICTHGCFGEELVKSAEMIAGKLEDVHTFSLLPGMDPQDYMNLVEKQLKDMEYKTLAMVDLFGGTPCNTLAILSKNYPLEIISGLNLAMLIEVYSQKDNHTVEDLAHVALTTLEQSGKDVLQVLNGK